MKKLIISGINIFEGGTLSVLKDLISTLILEKAFLKFDITIFVHKKELFNEFIGYKILFIELPLSKKNYIFRLFYEYIFFFFYSNRHIVDTWISMHDITPNVKARKRIVYCHNPSPFYKMSLGEIKLSYNLWLFTIFYRYIYRINIKKNDFVVVQQHWIKKEFEKLFRISNIIVSYPELSNQDQCHNFNPIKKEDKTIFFYPALPRVFKNFEVICKAVELLNKLEIFQFKVIFTIKGNENKYSRFIYKNYKNFSNIEFMGKINRDEVFRVYDLSDCLIFPSKLETWGMPISEYKKFNKPILISNYSYARETIGEYNNVSFFDPNNHNALAIKMKEIILGNFVTDGKLLDKIPDPDIRSWKELINRL